MQLDQVINALQDIAKSLHDANYTNWWLVWATIIVALSSIIIGILDRRSQEAERFERVRSWLVIDGPYPVQVVLPTGTPLSWDAYSKPNAGYVSPRIVRVAMKITNTGTRPAQNIREGFLAKETIFERQELVKKTEDETKFDSGPNQISYRSHDINWQTWQQLSEDSPIFLGLSLTYYNGKKECHSGSIFRLTRGQWLVVDSWYD